MDCTDLDNQVLLFAAGALDAAEAEAVRRHLAGGCPNCAGKLAESHSTLALLAMSPPMQSPSSAARGRLIARLGEMRQSPGNVESPMRLSGSRASGKPPWWAQIALPAAIAAAIAAAVTIFFAQRLQTRQIAAAAPSADVERTIGALSALVETQQHQIAAMRAAAPATSVDWASDHDLKMIWLVGSPSQPAGAHGRVFWDTDRNEWHFFASGLKPAAPGKTYELWFVSTDGQTAVPAGSFSPNSDGDAFLKTDVPAELAPRLGIAAVTDEPAGATVTNPTGSFQLTTKQ